jgi:hypothetical protein
MRWLVLDTMGDAEARGDELSAAMGYPRLATRTERASLPIEHPDSGEGAVPIDPSVWSWAADALTDMASLLTDVERLALSDRAEMLASGWFPTTSPPEG